MDDYNDDCTVDRNILERCSIQQLAKIAFKKIDS